MVNDAQLFQIVIAGLVIWALIGVAGFLHWWKKTAKRREWNRSTKLLQQGKIPENYDIITQRARDLNNLELDPKTATPDGAKRVRQRMGELRRIREATARVRESGYVVGNNARHRNQTIERALKENPYNKRTDPGAYKQWIRGCCMGFASPGNPCNPADYI